MNLPLPYPTKSVSVAFPYEFLRRRVLMTLVLLLAFLFTYMIAGAQNLVVSEVITDYNGYWKSGSNAISAVKPENSHNLLSFTANGTRYSTGVSDSTLTARGDAFTPGEYRALPVYAISGTVTSNTKIGLGASYDGVPNGAPAVKPENNMIKYLTDGKNGLDLGTCVANLPTGTITFSVSNMQLPLIGDGIPDLLITQIADPSVSSPDSYEFADVYGNRVGNAVDIVLYNLPVQGNWIADFYEASTTPMTLSTGYVRSERALRFWTADFKAFGITSSNISQVAYFRIKLNGNSDVAFVAYNNKTFNISSLLPTKLNYFKGNLQNGHASLTWQTAQEQNTDKFIVECSHDNTNFTVVDSVKAAGYSQMIKNYSFTHQQVYQGKTYYRLKMIDKDGVFTYSPIVMVNNSYGTSAQQVNVFPNPASSKLTISHSQASGNESCTVRTIHGAALLQKSLTAGSVQTTLDVQQLPAGSYVVVVSNGNEQTSQLFVKK